jgi:5'-methylthioadenosine phosphorylase
MTSIIFGGTAAYHLKLDEFAAVGERRVIDTPYGPSSPFVHLSAGERSAWFSSRHGEDGLQRSAAFVNHRANIWAARELGADAILSWNGVGAIAPGLAVGQSRTDDLLTYARASHRSIRASLKRVTTHQPLPSRWGGSREDTVLPAARFQPSCALGSFRRAPLAVPCATHGTYVCTEGPRLETAAEIALYGWGGAAVVGMTLAPEVWLAAEAGIPYASLCIVTNMATGRWQLDPRRDFGPNVGQTGLRVLLAAVG